MDLTPGSHDDASYLKPAPGAVGAPFRVFYRRIVDDLQALVRTSDLDDVDNFHGALSIIVALGVNQSEFAKWRGFRASTVNRWVNGTKAPPIIRRGPIVRDALGMLLENMAKGAPVALRSNATLDFDEEPERPQDERGAAHAGGDAPSGANLSSSR